MSAAAKRHSSTMRRGGLRVCPESKDLKTQAVFLVRLTNSPAPGQVGEAMNISRKSTGDAVALVVDDEALLRAVITEVLFDADIKVFEACSADEAIQLLTEHTDIDCVLTDVEMPGSMNGIALAGTIARRWPAILIIVTSGCSLPSGDVLPEGVEFVPKPFDANDIVMRVRRRAGKPH